MQLRFYVNESKLMSYYIQSKLCAPHINVEVAVLTLVSVVRVQVINV